MCLCARPSRRSPQLSRYSSSSGVRCFVQPAPDHNRVSTAPVCWLRNASSSTDPTRVLSSEDRRGTYARNGHIFFQSFVEYCFHLECLYANPFIIAYCTSCFVVSFSWIRGAEPSVCIERNSIYEFAIINDPFFKCEFCFGEYLHLSAGSLPGTFFGGQIIAPLSGHKSGSFASVLACWMFGNHFLIPSSWITT